MDADVLRESCMHNENRSVMPVGVLLALVSAVSFASLGIFVKFLYASGFSPLAALSWRFILSGSVLWVWYFAFRGFRVERKKFVPVLLLGVFGFSAQAGLFFGAVRYLDVSLAALLLYLYPAFVVLFGRMFHKKEATRAQLFAVVVSLLGGALALRPTGAQVSAMGVAFGLGCALWYSNYLLVSERILKNVDAFLATASLSLGAALVFSGILAVRGEFVVPHSREQWLLIGGVALVATVLPIVTLFAAIRRIGAARASLVSSFEIVPTVVAGALLLGDKLHWVQWMGAVFIVVAVVLIQKESRESQG
jgi:drug/metabolite transporter (DMT)-like permease